MALISCEFQAKSKEPESKDLRSCLSSAKSEVHKEFTDASLELIKQYDSKKGYIPLLLEQRRKIEFLCNNLAECYKNQEPQRSFEFEECLDGWQNNSYEQN